MANLTQADEINIGQWRKDGIIRETWPDDFKHLQGDVATPCADGHRFIDLFEKHKAQCLNHDEKPLLHILTDHGGALVLGENSPVNQPTEKMVDFFFPLLAQVFPALLWKILCKIRLAKHMTKWLIRRYDIFALWRIQMGLMVKGIDDISLYAHAPCGAAAAHGLSANEVLYHYMRAYRRTTHIFQGVRVRCFFHVCYRDGRERTYVVDENAAVRWLFINTKLPPIL